MLSKVELCQTEQNIAQIHGSTRMVPIPVLVTGLQDQPYPNQGTLLGFMILNTRGREALQG